MCFNPNTCVMCVIPEETFSMLLRLNLNNMNQEAPMTLIFDFYIAMKHSRCNMEVSLLSCQMNMFALIRRYLKL